MAVCSSDGPIVGVRALVWEAVGLFPSPHKEYIKLRLLLSRGNCP